MIKATLLLLAASTAALAQTPPAKPPAFEVVSIRPSGPKSSQGFQIQADGFRATGLPLITTLMMAYFPPAVASSDALKNLPAWVTNESYDLIAKVAPEDLAAWHAAAQNRFKKPLLEAMLQTAFAERCKLVIHRVPTEIAGRAVVVDKRGSLLKPSDPNAPLPEQAMILAGGGRAKFTGKDRTHIEWTFQSATMEDLANFVNNSGVPTQDRTNIAGHFDFVLAYEPYDPPEATPGLPPPPPDPHIWNLKPLGLRIDPIKITISTVVIDHIEKPSEN